MPQPSRDQLTSVLVIGAGPVGLAAGAHLYREGKDFVILEAGPTVGHAVRKWGHVRLFTPWKYLVDDAARALLEASGWEMPDPEDIPTGQDLVNRYLDPLARLPELSSRILPNTRALAVTRRGLDKVKSAGRGKRLFDVRTEDGHRYLVGAVIDASGTYEAPNPLGSGGLAALGETAAADHLSYGIPDVRARDRSRYANVRVGVVGSGHSAFNALLDLAELVDHEGTDVTWFVRSTELDRLWGGGDTDQLSERGSLGQRMRQLAASGRIAVHSGFAVDTVLRTEGGVVLSSMDGRESQELDEVIVATGFRPDLTLTRELRLDLDPIVEAPSALAPLIDPNVHSCGTVPPHGHRELAHPEPGFFTVGMKSYGRAPTFLLLTGYEQVRSVVKSLVGDTEAADRVELRLPETGVCSTNLGLVGAGAATGGGSCCS